MLSIIVIAESHYQPPPAAQQSPEVWSSAGRVRPLSSSFVIDAAPAKGMSNTPTPRPIVYWNGKVTKKWDGKSPRRMTEAQIEAMKISWPGFAEQLRKQESFREVQPMIYSHGAVFLQSKKTAPVE